MNEKIIITFAKDAEEKPLYAVISARYRGQWIFVRHQQRSSYEVPGGKIEPGEDALTAAKRELYEETGALDFDLSQISYYSVTKDNKTNWGTLFFAEIEEMGPLPEYEIAERIFLSEMPEFLTYPDIQPILQKRVLQWLYNKNINK